MGGSEGMVQGLIAMATFCDNALRAQEDKGQLTTQCSSWGHVSWSWGGGQHTLAVSNTSLPAEESSSSLDTTVRRQHA